jgi:hypothetical protein
MANCESHNALGDRQDGFRKGRSTIRTLLQNEILNDYNKRLRINNLVGMTDISGCFDRILPPIISMLNIKNGCPQEAVNMHAETLQHAKYFLKTKNGLSDSYYSHSSDTPVYGNGQGAGDSPSQWSQESAMLLDLYEREAPGATMTYRDGSNAVSIPITAFADDTNLLGNDNNRTKTTEQLVAETKQAFKIWNRLLHATGHFMELGKCACYLSIWDFQHDGYAYTRTPEELQITIEVNDVNGNKQIIPQLESDKSQKLLGVMRNPIGNQQDEVARLKQKSDSLAIKINSHALSFIETKLAYEAFYVPAMRYSLSITSINQMDLERIQTAGISAILTASGYNRHMPREVVFAPRIYQGLGFKHLYDLQGCDATRLLLQEISSKNTSTQKMLAALIDTIQLEAGIENPILEDTRPLDYIEWGWIPQIREFLHHIKGKIQGINATLPGVREGDRYIMDSPFLKSCTYKNRMLIHRCRIFLQVELLSDISNANGDRILEQWKNNKPNKPSRSHKKWPAQRDPGNEAWKIWKKFLHDSFENSNSKLREPLGKWIGWNQTRTHDGYYDLESRCFFHSEDAQIWRKYKQTARTRRQMIFQKENSTLDLILPPTAVPIDILTETGENRITSLPPNRIDKQRQEPTPTSLKEKLQLARPELFPTTTFMLEENDIAQILSQPTYIETASDGGFNPQSGISSFGWIVVMNKTIVAMGRGPAAAHPDLAESFRAEGYGLAAVSILLTIIVEHFNVEKQNHVWKFYIDNKAMIQRMQSYRWKGKISKANLRSDADITNIADDYLQNFPAILIHVKSHQDNEKAFEELSFAAQLNVMADAQATQQHDTMDKPLVTVTNSQPLLVIDDIPITRDSQKWILEKAGEIPIRQYYEDKYGWEKDTFHDIDWETQKKAISTYPDNDQRRILKFNHEWLPTSKRMFREGTDKLPSCRICNHLEETNDHLLTCTRDIQEHTRHQIIEFLWKDTMNHGNSELNNILELALTESPHNENWTPILSAVSPNLRKCIIQQNKIGWKQLYKGRMTKEMKVFMEQHYRNLQVDSRRYTGTRWCKTLIRNIWNTVLQLWKQRNKIIHGETTKVQNSTTKERLEKRVHKCFEFRDNLKREDREKIFYTDAHTLLQEEQRYIKAWIKLAERIIKITKKRTRKDNKFSQTHGKLRSVETNCQQENPHSGGITTRLTPSYLPSNERSVWVY